MPSSLNESSVPGILPDPPPLLLFSARGDGSLLSTNRAFRDAFPEAEPGSLVFDQFDWSADDQSWWKAVATSELDATRQVDVRTRSRNAPESRTLLLQLSADTSGEAVVYQGVLFDVRAQQDREEALRHTGTHDLLTGLPLRTLFLARVEQALAHAHREPNYDFVVGFLDLDRFKVINDSFGHAAGDHVLRTAAERIAGSLDRAGDTVARFAGDEFVVLLDDTANARRAGRVIDQIQAALREPMLVDGQEIYIGSSVGLVADAGSYATADKILRDADTAMYRAKKHGKGGYRVFDRKMHEEAVAASTLEIELRRAVEHGNFELHYQPIVTLGRGDVIAFESLLRWRRDDGTLECPSTFLQLAEETGLILRIGEWAIRAACIQATTWRAHGHGPRVTINLSTLQFRQKDLTDMLRTVLDETGLEPQALEIEVTEESLLDDGDEGRATVERLRDLGVLVSIDDFGVGCFSLSQLRQLPVNTLKVHPSLLLDVADRGGDAAIVRAVIDLGHSLGFQVVAEGVETSSQLAFLRSHGCDALQGRLFQRPMTPEQLDEMIGDPGSGELPNDMRLPETADLEIAAVDGDATVRRSKELRGVVILLVEDDDASRRALVELLEMDGATLHATASAEEAAKTFDQIRPDVLVSDISLPGMSGYELVEQLRERVERRGGVLPAIALTAHGSTEDRVTAFRAGFVGHISKPVQPSELLTLIRSLLARERPAA